MREWGKDDAARESAPSLIDADDPHRRACTSCGYDLAGHADDAGECPECGFPFEQAAELEQDEVLCLKCGKPVPGHFDKCWHCGTTLPA